MSVKNILKTHTRQAKRCKKLRAHYIKVPCYYKKIRVNLFFVKIGKSNTWHLLLTTDLELGFIKLMEVYQIRWSIEVFFKECKQYLHLGDCKSSNFNAQIADTTISMLQHIMLSYYKRINHQQIFGDLFKQLNSELVELGIVAKLLDVFWELVQLLCSCAGIDFIIFQQDLMRNDKVLAKLINLVPERCVDKAA